MCDCLNESSINGNIQPIFCNVVLEKAIGYNIPEKSIVTQCIKTSTPDAIISHFEPDDKNIVQVKVEFATFTLLLIKM